MVIYYYIYIFTNSIDLLSYLSLKNNLSQVIFLLANNDIKKYLHFQEGPSSKKLHLVKKPLIGSSAAAFVGLLEKCKSSDEALQLLLRISDCLQFQESDVDEAIKKLSEHFQSEEEAAVRVKILWLFCDIGLECPGAKLNNLIDETIHLIKNETSHKVIIILVYLLNSVLIGLCFYSNWCSNERMRKVNKKCY